MKIGLLHICRPNRAERISGQRPAEEEVSPNKKKTALNGDPLKRAKISKKFRSAPSAQFVASAIGARTFSNKEEQIIETQDKPQCLVAAKATLTLTIPGCG